MKWTAEGGCFNAAVFYLVVGLALVGYGIYLIFSKKRQDFILCIACIIAGAVVLGHFVLQIFS